MRAGQETQYTNTTLQTDSSPYSGLQSTDLGLPGTTPSPTHTNQDPKSQMNSLKHLIPSAVCPALCSTALFALWVEETPLPP